MVFPLNRSTPQPLNLLKVETTRFSDVVGKCGEPETYTVWGKSPNDAQLKRLVAQNRLMTIRRGAGADFGEVGFHEAKSTIYLRFPKSLKRFAGQRIIGIKWDMVEP